MTLVDLSAYRSFSYLRRHRSVSHIAPNNYVEKLVRCSVRLRHSYAAAAVRSFT